MSNNTHLIPMSIERSETAVLSLSVIILTFNEEKHIARCIKSIQSLSQNIFIIDSFSTDKTIEIAESLGCKCYQHKWENNHALQFNWGLQNLPIDTDWVMRLDADEYILPELAAEMKDKLPFINKDISGINIKRRVIFMNKWIRRGGYYPTILLRIWRSGSGFLEQRWMDEHVKLEWGNNLHFNNDLVDHNLNNLTWWINKHNNYATRETVDFLIYKFSLTGNANSIAIDIRGEQDKRKRWLKEKIYFNTPLFLRPFLYFSFRYFLKLGFLDGRQGLIWHFFQGFWYRFLVDAKVYEIYKKVGKNKDAIKDFLEKEYSFRL
jgi:glycosyltransferase involved in cell wall biosynthesis